ncbi:MAG TPA: bifunctional UDP-N-acetylglucosamine diphosphorylase/glucosamine-1-phosphate N-acetyltransferase GlmU [Dongiaceae bacterium]|jgi:bifunctional UDP-N-acetylglucosamine pyrophosphorylase/glucosamine-1-phosphate N-acetyltransferase|nr:bifunctional UDP-N-acetylglucosamine diphosphorylase/glucosamine-1-phosphate N-acetyltransferase GlmU [Dongiaceae bacterium]
MAIILAAGRGERMLSPLPKVAHEIGGRSLLDHVLSAVAPLAPAKTVPVLAPGMSDLAATLQDFPVAIQERPLGTGDAVRAGLGHSGAEEDVLILYGDTPFVQTETLHALVARRAEKDNPALVLLAMRPRISRGYGRMVTDDGGNLLRIVEEKDTSAAERAIPLCNGGVMVAEGAFLRQAIPELVPANAKGEYYLTDLVALAVKKGRQLAYIETSEEEVLGINTQAELAGAEHLFQERKRLEALERGVTLRDPGSVYFSWDTMIGRGCVIEPHVVFGRGVTIEKEALIRSFSYIEGARIGTGAIVGPFARIRPTSEIASAAHIGNFVEIKNARIGSRAKANHLSYIGDAEVGEAANIGAGTITCNYDGVAKHRTKIGDSAFIGSNTALVAPVEIGAGAMVGAGSVITRRVAEDALALSRAPQIERRGWASLFRAKRRKG